MFACKDWSFFKKPRRELEDKFEIGRTQLRADPTMLDASIDKLSEEAQEPAKKFLALLMTKEEDVVMLNRASSAFKEGLSESARMEFEEWKHEVAAVIGLTAA